MDIESYFMKFISINTTSLENELQIYTKDSTFIKSKLEQYI